MLLNLSLIVILVLNLTRFHLTTSVGTHEWVERLEIVEGRTRGGKKFRKTTTSTTNWRIGLEGGCGFGKVLEEVWVLMR